MEIPGVSVHTVLSKGVIGYASSGIDLVHATAGYARLISLLMYTTTGYTNNEKDLDCAQ